MILLMNAFELVIGRCISCSAKALAVIDTTVELIAPFNDLVLTITTNNGKEFLIITNFLKKLECDYFFAVPYRSWWMDIMNIPMDCCGNIDLNLQT